MFVVRRRTRGFFDAIFKSQTPYDAHQWRHSLLLCYATGVSEPGGVQKTQAPPTLDFGRSGNPTLTRGAEYASHKLLIAPPSIFRPSAIPVLSSVSVLLVAMDGWVKVSKCQELKRRCRCALAGSTQSSPKIKIFYFFRLHTAVDSIISLQFHLLV